MTALAIDRAERFIASRHGHELILAATGAEALEYAVSSSPDLIVLDTQLPDADGREVLVPLKRDPSTALIPVVAWAGGREERESERRTALELGAQGLREHGECRAPHAQARAAVRATVASFSMTRAREGDGAVAAKQCASRSSRQPHSTC